MTAFDDIRPFHDEEVSSPLEELLTDKEFLSTLLRLKYPGLAKTVPGLLRPIVGYLLRKETAGISSIDGIQSVVAHYMNRMVASTTDGFSSSGLEQLDLTRPHLFISNHRDIALDSAFVNLALYQKGAKTVRIATGDNLMTKPFATSLMRLNKSFFVKRNVSGMRALLAATRQLSAYIHHSISIDREPVWIAQREGRAKDGRDRTDIAVVKMLALNKAKSESFEDYIKELRVVPVAVSYEYDPCDLDKVREVHETRHGAYEKGTHEDIASLGQGIMGYKGRVHASFGSLIDQGAVDARELATEIDRQIITRYRLFPSNVLSYKLLTGEMPGAGLMEEETSIAQSMEQGVFRKRINECPPTLRQGMLEMYSNPVRSKMELATGE